MTTKKTTHRTPKTAAEDYEWRRERVRRRMDQLRDALQNLDREHQKDVKVWGYGGTLGAIERQLIEAVAILQNCEPEQVDDVE